MQTGSVYVKSGGKLDALLENYYSFVHCVFLSFFFTFLSLLVLGEPETIDWYSPQGEKITSNQRVVVQREGIRSWLTIYNANIDDAGIYRCQAIDSKGHTQESTVVLEIYREYL